MNDRDVIRMRDYVDLRLDDQNRALELAAKELSRRLDDLNHSHAQLIEMQAKFIDRVAYEYGYREMTGRIIGLERVTWGLGAVVAFLAFAVPTVLHLVYK